MALLKTVPPEILGAALKLVVADTGATDHMLPDRSACISYKSARNLRVHMGNNSYALVLGQGTTIISLNGQRLLIHKVLHVPALWVPLYSLCEHIRQPGWGFLGSYETGFHVYFPGVVLSIDTSINCHLSYTPLGKSAPLPTLHYISRDAPLPPTQQSTWPIVLTLALPHLRDCLSQHCLPSSKRTPLLLAPCPFPPCPALITMNIFHHFTPWSQNVPLILVLHLPSWLTLHPPDFCRPSPRRKSSEHCPGALPPRV